MGAVHRASARGAPDQPDGQGGSSRGGGDSMHQNLGQDWLPDLSVEPRGPDVVARHCAEESSGDGHATHAWTRVRVHAEDIQ